MHGPALRTALLGAALFVLVLVPGEVRSHKLDEVLVDLTLGDDSWSAEAELDSRYVVANLMRHHLPPKPNLDWIHSRSPGEYELMRHVTERFYREKFQFVMGGVVAEAGLEFPDYATDPPRFTADEEGTPAVRVRMTGDYPAESGPIILKWNSDWGPTLVLLLKRKGEESQPSAVLVGLGEEADLGMRGASHEGGGGEKGAAAPARWSGWVSEGFVRILPAGGGLVLFIAALFLLVPERKPVLAQVICFALAQFAALVVVVLARIDFPASGLGLLATLSVAYIGVENLFLKRLGSWRLGIVTGFGLVYGMALGCGLMEAAPTASGMADSLAEFGVGVAAGQAVVILGATLAAGLLVRTGKFDRVRRFGSALIAFVGVYWMVELLMV